MGAGRGLERQRVTSEAQEWLHNPDRAALRHAEILRRWNAGELVSLDEASFVYRHEGVMQCLKVRDELQKGMSPQTVNDCIASAFYDVAAARTVAYRRHLELQERIAALEAMVKPRVRRRAGSSPA